MLYNFGKEGVSFEFQKNADGAVEPIYSDIITNPAVNGGLTMAQSMAKYIRANYGGPFVQDVGYIERIIPMKSRRKLLTDSSDAWKYKMPNMTYTNEEQKRLNDILTPIYTYRERLLRSLFRQA